MKKSWQICGLFLCVALMLAPVAHAADQALFVPTSSWLVGPASPVAVGEGQKMPCVMINQYDNGFTFRFSGGGGKLMALAVDFRQKVFKPGKSYRVNIEVPPYVDVALPGTAYNEATLIVNTQQIDGFYKNVSEAKELKLGVGDSKMEFALLGVPEGLSRIESCYEGAAEERKTAPPAMPVPAAAGLSLPQQGAPLEGMKELPGIITPMPDEAIPQVPVAQPASGETAAAVDAMLQGAAQQMGRMEPAAGLTVPDKPEAVATQGQMLARSWASPLAPQAQNPAPHRIMASNEGSAAAPAMATGEPQRSWRALGGTSLQESLKAWAEAADVDLMWMAGQDFSVTRSISMQGSFEAAVLSLLEQYESADPRPVGRIYNGPASGRKVLLVEVHRDY